MRGSMGGWGEVCRLILLCTVSLDPRPLIQEDLSPATAFIQEMKSCHCCSRVSGLRGRVDGGAESGDNCHNCGKPHARVRAHHPRSRGSQLSSVQILGGPGAGISSGE